MRVSSLQRISPHDLGGRAIILAVTAIAAALSATPAPAVRVIYPKQPKAAPTKPATTPPPDAETQGPATDTPPARPGATQKFVITAFSTIRVEAPIDVVIDTGRGTSAIGTGSRATLDALSFLQSGDTLTIRINRQALGADSDRRGPATLRLTTGTLQRAALIGAGTLTIDLLKGPTTEASLSGSGAMRIGRVDTDRLVLAMVGAGSLNLAGKAGDIDATISGGGSVGADGLNAHRLRLDVAGGVSVLFRSDETARITANGAATVDVAGNGACTVRTLGNASVRCSGKSY